MGESVTGVFPLQELEVICTNNTVYTRVWPSIGASYNHLLHEYNSIQCSSRCDYKRNHITTSELLQDMSGGRAWLQGGVEMSSTSLELDGATFSLFDSSAFM